MPKVPPAGHESMSCLLQDAVLCITIPHFEYHGHAAPALRPIQARVNEHIGAALLAAVGIEKTEHLHIIQDA